MEAAVEEEASSQEEEASSQEEEGVTWLEASSIIERKIERKAVEEEEMEVLNFVSAHRHISITFAAFSLPDLRLSALLRLQCVSVN
jgi:hypothetical protein